MKILATNGLEREGVDLLQQAGFTVDTGNEKTWSDYDVLIIRTATQVTRNSLFNKGKLKVICTATVGFNHIDIDAATEQDIVIMNVPGGNANAVAEHTIGFILALARKLPEAHNSLKKLGWKKIQGEEIAGKTLGIIGFGTIGSAVAKKARALGMRVCAADPYVDEKTIRENNVLPMRLEELMRQADFVTLHCSLNEETRQFIGVRELACMKQGASIINCARGEVVDERALKDALAKKKVRAALDVFEGEPAPDPELIALADVVSSHSAGSTNESRSFISGQAAQQVINGLIFDKWENTINLPPLDPALKPYTKLASVLGQFAAKLWFVGAPKIFSEITLEYCGMLSTLDTRITTQSALRGLISTFSSKGPVGLVNAHLAAQKRGFTVTSVASHKPIDYTSMIALEVRGKNCESHRIEGTIIGNSKLQIIGIDGYPINIEPNTIMLVFVNEDTPGVIADVTTIIGKEFGVNIKQFALSDRNRDGTAMAAISLSTLPCEKELLSRIHEKMGERIHFLKILTF